MLRITATILALILFSSSLSAQALRVVQVTDNVYAIVGDLGNRSPANLGNNATFGLVVTDDGAVLIDAGASYLGAKALHNMVRSVTDQPVVKVINTGGQDHRWLGNGYWHEQGAHIIATKAAVADHKDRGSLQLTGLTQLITEFMLAGTEPYYADETFSGSITFTLGGVRFALTHAPAHTPGEAFVWLEDQSVMFTGDIVYTERMLGIIEVSSTPDWMASFEAMAAHEPKHVVPGHGNPTDLASAEFDTYDYLTDLRDLIGAHIDEGGDMIGSVKVDQSGFSYLLNFENLAGRNAQ